MIMHKRDYLLPAEVETERRNSMKNRLITLAAALGLIAVIGRYYALPVVAQTIRAALLANVDEEGRVPYRASIFLSCTNVDCIGQFPIVPTGKRLVVKHVFAQPSLTSSAGQELIVRLQGFG